MQLIEPTTPLIFLPQCAYRYRPIIFVGKLFLIIEFIQEVSKSQSKKRVDRVSGYREWPRNLIFKSRFFFLRFFYFCLAIAYSQCNLQTVHSRQAIIVRLLVEEADYLLPFINLLHHPWASPLSLSGELHSNPAYIKSRRCTLSLFCSLKVFSHSLCIVLHCLYFYLSLTSHSYYLPPSLTLSVSLSLALQSSCNASNLYAH